MNQTLIDTTVNLQVPAIAVETSANSKVGPCSVTMCSQASCPNCALRGKGCYGESGTMAWISRRLNSSPITDPAIIARYMADGIDRLTGMRPLRLNVVGDTRTNRAAKIVSRAAARYHAKWNQVAWAYTHAFREVARKSWGGVSILASCETVADVKAATAAGYATALVVAEFERDTAYVKDGVTILPCPHQTGRSMNCTTCRLCWDDQKLLASGTTIGFAAHGSRRNRVKEVLIQLN